MNQRRISELDRMKKLIRWDRFRYRLKKLLSRSLERHPPYNGPTLKPDEREKEAGPLMVTRPTFQRQKKALFEKLRHPQLRSTIASSLGECLVPECDGMVNRKESKLIFS